MTTNTFRTAVVRTPAGPDSIEIIDVPIVDPGRGEVRVRVAAAPVNPVDLAVVDGVFHDMGLIHQPAWTGLGWDFAGTVDAVGPAVDLAPGTRVAGMIDGFDRDHGTYAEQLVVPVANIAVVPDQLDLTVASTVPLNGLAASQILDLLGDAATGRDRLLVTGAAGAVGGYVTALAPDRGWHVTGLARAEDEEFVHGLGAEFTTWAERGWDAVADGGVLQQRGTRPRARRWDLRRRPAGRTTADRTRHHGPHGRRPPGRATAGRPAHPHRVRRAPGQGARRGPPRPGR